MVSAVPRNLQNQPYICSSCIKARHFYKSPIGLVKSQRRSISMGYIAKTEAAADQWAIQANEIEAGKRKSVLSLLEERGYVNQIAG